MWEVINQEEGEEYFDIRLSFRPAGRFTGEAGVEQFIIDKTGNIEVRQVLDEPSGLIAPGRRGPRRLLLAGIGLVVVADAAVVALFAVGENTIGPQSAPAPPSTPTRSAAAYASAGYRARGCIC